MTPSRLYSWLFSSGLLGLLAFTVATIAPITPRQATAAPPAPLPDELQYIPHDAAFFIHADAAAVWASSVLKTFREADKATIEKLENLVALYFRCKARQSQKHHAVLSSNQKRARGE